MDGSGSAEVRSGDVAHQNALSVFAHSGPAAAANKRSGIASHGVRPRRSYQAAIAGTVLGTGRNIQWHSGIGGQASSRAGPQQPAVQPGLFRAGPGRGGRVLERPDRRTCAPARRSAPAAPPRRRPRTRRPRRSSSAPAPPGRPPAGVPPHRSAAGPIRRGAGSEPSPAFPDPATRPSVTERVRPFARQPRQPGYAPAVRLDGTFRARGRAGRSDGPGTESHPGARFRAAACARTIRCPRWSTGLPSASRPVTRAQFARPVGNDSPGTDRQPFVVVARVGHGLGYFGGFQHRIDDHAAAAVGHSAVVGAVVDEQPQPVARSGWRPGRPRGRRPWCRTCRRSTPAGLPAANRRRRRAPAVVGVCKTGSPTMRMGTTAMVG